MDKFRVWNNKVAQFSASRKCTFQTSENRKAELKPCLLLISSDAGHYNPIGEKSVTKFGCNFLQFSPSFYWMEEVWNSNCSEFLPFTVGCHRVTINGEIMASKMLGGTFLMDRLNLGLSWFWRENDTEGIIWMINSTPPKLVHQSTLIKKILNNWLN